MIQPLTQSSFSRTETLPVLRRFLPKCCSAIAAILFFASSCLAQGLATLQSSADPLAELNKKYPGLLPAAGDLFLKLFQNVDFPPPRNQSKLLPLLPDSTVLYLAIPNYGGVAHQTLDTVRAELQNSAALRDFVQDNPEFSKLEPKIEDALKQTYQLHEFLGDEIVISGAMQGDEPKLLMVTVVKKPGLQTFLAQTIEKIGGGSHSGMHVYDLQGLAGAVDKSQGQDLQILVRPDYLIAAEDLRLLRSTSNRLDQRNAVEATLPFKERLAKEYAGGITVLGGADLQKLLKETSKNGIPEPLRQSGLADVKYFVWGHKETNGATVSQSELTFAGPRRGVASWLAPTASLSTIDFVSPKAMVALTLVLKDPAQIFEDARELAGTAKNGPFEALRSFEKMLGVSLRDDVLANLSGELTLELDDVTPPKPAWRIILKTKDTENLQKTLAILLAAANLKTEHLDEAGITYTSMQVPTQGTMVEIAYAFADGHMIIGSGLKTVSAAVQMHRNGNGLAKSQPFLAALPPGHSLNASALLYQDPLATTALQMRRISPGLAASLKDLPVTSAPAVVGVYAEDSTIRSASKNAFLDAGVVMAAAAVAIPNLVRSRTAANEASAVGSVRTINTAEVVYASTYPQKGYARDLARLGPQSTGAKAPSPEHADLLDSLLGASSCTANNWCTKSGYAFLLSSICKQDVCNDYVVVATPMSDKTGTRSFCSTSDAIIRFKTGEPITAPVTTKECRAWHALQ
jgi:hypothetical protein